MTKVFNALLLIFLMTVQSIEWSKVHYEWEEVPAIKSYNFNNVNVTIKLKPSNNPLSLPGIPAEKLVNQPVYVSLATIAKRIDHVEHAIMTILQGTVVPTRIYLFISRHAFILDTGVKEIPESLLQLTLDYPVSIIYTNNLGPHRKLLPLLWKKYNEDCVIITVDDDLEAKKNSTLVSSLLKYYVASNRKSVVALRARRIGLCANYPHKPLHYNHWGIASTYGNRELFMLPTGTGGVLYRPQFFDEVVFDHKFRQLTHFADDLMFRLATMIRNVTVVVGCREIYKDGFPMRTCPRKAIIYDTYKGALSPTTLRCPTLAKSKEKKQIESEAKKYGVECTQQMIIDAWKKEDSNRDRAIVIDNKKKLLQMDNATVAKYFEDVKHAKDEDATAFPVYQEKKIGPMVKRPDKRSLRGSSKVITVDKGNNNNDNLNDNDKESIRNPGMKEATLYSVNNRGGNDMQWYSGVAYLHKKGVYHFTDVASKYLQKERKALCGTAKDLEAACSLKMCFG